MPQLIGPFRQILSFVGIPLKGSISDAQVTVVHDGAILIENGFILKFGPLSSFNTAEFDFVRIEGDHVLIPGFVDCHTHLVWAGSRHQDYAMRMSGKSYQDILAAGGGIFDTVSKTQHATVQELVNDCIHRVGLHTKNGVTTIEIKSGYGLTLPHELKILEVIRKVQNHVKAELISTCLAAHVCPKEYETEEFLHYILQDILPEVKKWNLANRVDVFVEEHAFGVDYSRKYLLEAKKMGFEIALHADQFSVGGSTLAVELGALSADHLEHSGDQEIEMLAASDVMPVALPGASLGLGMQFTPGRKLLNAGAGLAIASDWNPGSAPMGDLLTQAAIFGAFEKLSATEVLAGITFRAAKALGLSDRGRLQVGERADLVAFPVSDFREILYHQGAIKPSKVWVKGEKV